MSDREHDVYLYGTLSAKLLERPAHVNTKFMFTGHLPNFCSYIMWDGFY